MTRDEAIDRAASRMSYAITKARMYGDNNGEFNADTILAEARAAFHQCLAASGYMVVPFEPTEDMIQTGRSTAIEQSGNMYFPSNINISSIYAAMLYAAREVK